MFSITPKSARVGTAAATLLGLMVLANPLYAGIGNLSQTTTKSPATPQMLAQDTSHGAMMHRVSAEQAETASSERIEAHITDLQNKLHITAVRRNRSGTTLPKSCATMRKRWSICSSSRPQIPVR